MSLPIVLRQCLSPPRSTGCMKLRMTMPLTLRQPALASRRAATTTHLRLLGSSSGSPPRPTVSNCRSCLGDDTDPKRCNRHGTIAVGVRWKHSQHRRGAKMGQHLETLDELAHQKSREQAEERRKKKKDKKAAKRQKKPAQHSAADSAVLLDDDDDDDDESLHGEEGEDELALLPDPADVKKRMMKIVDGFTESLKAIRGAEPTPELFDDIQVQAYGTNNTPLKAVAQVVISTPTLATATCFDPALAKPVSLAIRDRLDLNPSVEEDGVVKIPLPRVSMETRQQTSAALGKRAEASRQRLRKVRRSAMEVVKQGMAGKLEGISKDEAFRVQKEIEAVTDQVLAVLNETAEKKHQSIMAV